MVSSALPAYRVGYVVEDDDAILAVFLDSGPDSHDGHLIAYAPMGQHTEASIDYIRSRPLAREDQFGKLHAFLARWYGEPPAPTPVQLVVDQRGVPR